MRLRRIVLAPLASALVFTLTVTSAFLLLASSTANAQEGAENEAWKWEGSRADEITGVGLDALLVRPLAAARVVVGAAFLVPAAILSSPGGRDAIEGAYEIFLREPAEYAFGRKLGDFDY